MNIFLNEDIPNEKSRFIASFEKLLNVAKLDPHFLAWQQ